MLTPQRLAQKLYAKCLSCCLRQGLSGPVLRDTARLSQRYPPIARYGVFGVSAWPIGCDTPSPFSEQFPLGEHAKWRCDTPPQKGYLSDTCAIPYENEANGCDTPFCNTISKGYCAIWGGISHLAAKDREMAGMSLVWNIPGIRGRTRGFSINFNPGKLRVCFFQARKKSTRINFFRSGDHPVGWGSSTQRGGGRKVRALPRKFVFPGFRREESGMSRKFCRDVPDPWGHSKS